MIGLIVLIAVPLIELALLIKVAKLAGFWPTLLWVIGTFMLGASVIARSGISSAVRLREAMRKGEPPVGAMVESTLVVIAGVLLMTPGLIADVAGFALLIPIIRRVAAAWLLRHTTWLGEPRMRPNQPGGETPSGRPGAPRADGPAREGPIIEGEFERLDERPMNERGGSGRDLRDPH